MTSAEKISKLGYKLDYIKKSWINLFKEKISVERQLKEALKQNYCTICGKALEKVNFPYLRSKKNDRNTTNRC